MLKPTNLMEAMLPIFLIHSIFCHGLIQYPHLNKSKLYYSFLYSVTTTIIFCMCLVYVYCKWSDQIFSNNFKSTFYVHTAIMTLAMIINVINSWIYKNESLIVNSRIITADDALKKLGVSINTRKEFFVIIATVVFWIFFSSFFNIVNIAATERNIDVSQKIMPSLVLQHGHHVNVLTNIIFCSFIKHMRIRFKSINQVLLDIFELRDDNSKHEKKTDYKWAISRRINFEKDFVKILHDVRYIHLELGILCRELTKIYGIPIILSLLTAYLNIVSILLLIFRVLVKPQNENFDKVVVIFSFFLWVIIFSFRIFAINYFCAEAVLEWKKAGEIIHKLEADSDDVNFQEEIKQFSIQILQNPLKFSPCGLFDLGYYFIRGFAGGTTAQVILGVQTYRFTAK